MLKLLDGLIDISNFKLFQTIETEDIIRINQFYINIKDRNRGIGSHEMKKITEYADQVGKDIILYATSSKNKRFYRRHGFQNSPEDCFIGCNMRRKKYGNG